MKPLELIHWKRFDIKGNLGGKAYIHPENTCQRRFTEADELSKTKRLTPSECAAEYWASSWREVYPGCSEEVQIESSRRLLILVRFATLPHAAETEYK